MTKLEQLFKGYTGEKAKLDKETKEILENLDNNPVGQEYDWREVKQEDAESKGICVCPNCGDKHTIEYGDVLLEDGTTRPSELIIYIRCDVNGKAYHIGQRGKKQGHIGVKDGGK